MARYLAKRLLGVLPVLLGVSVVAFLLVRLVPGDPVTAMLGAQYNEAQAAALREHYGLNRPLPVQYAKWLGHVVRGDLGRSVFTRQPVREAIAPRVPVKL